MFPSVLLLFFANKLLKRGRLEVLIQELAKDGIQNGIICVKRVRCNLRPPKLTTRQRTREQRATKIEKLMEDMDEKIDAHYKKMKDSRTTERILRELVQRSFKSCQVDELSEGHYCT